MFTVSCSWKKNSGDLVFFVNVLATFFENDTYVWLYLNCRTDIIATIIHKNETNNKFYWKVAFLMYTEMVNLKPHHRIKNHTKDWALVIMVTRLIRPNPKS